MSGGTRLRCRGDAARPPAAGHGVHALAAPCHACLAGDRAASIFRGARYAAQKDPRTAPGRLQSRTEPLQNLKGGSGHGFRS
jgi:hypothetical protein